MHHASTMSHLSSLLSPKVKRFREWIELLQDQKGQKNIKLLFGCIKTLETIFLHFIIGGWVIKALGVKI